MKKPLVAAALLLIALLGIVVGVILVLLPPPTAPDEVDGARDAALVDGRARDGRSEARRREHVAREHVVSEYCEVVEEDGAPADRATVVVALAHSPAQRLMTAADGRAEWTPPPAGTNVFAVREGVACSRDAETSGDERIVLRLGVGATLKGTVEWTDGGPAPDVVVEMSLWKRGYTTEWATRTDAGGRFVFRGIPPGARLRPQVRHAADVVPVGDTESIDAPEWGESISVVLRARRPGIAEIRLDLEFPEGAEVPDVGVVEFTDGDGANLSVAHLGFHADTRHVAGRVRADTKTILRVTVGAYSGETAPFTASDGEKLRMPLVMRPSGRLLLRAVDQDGEPVAVPGLVAHLVLQNGDQLDPLQGRAFGEGMRVDVTELLPTDGALAAGGAQFHVVLDGPGIARGGLHSDRGPNLTLGGCQLLHRLRSEGDVALDVPLHRPMRATIVTVDSDGIVVPNVVLDLVPPNGFRPATVQTDDDGRATVEVLLDTSAAERESAWKRAKATAVKMHRGTAALEAPRSPHATPEWMVVVEALRTYRVRVVDAFGAGVAGGHVETGYWQRWALDVEGKAEVLLRPGETIAYVADAHESAPAPAPDVGDEIVVVATPVPELILDIHAPGGVLDDDQPSVNIRIWTDSGTRFSTHDLTGETTRVTLQLRGVAGATAFGVLVATGTGYFGEVESAPTDGPVSVTLEHRR